MLSITIEMNRISTLFREYLILNDAIIRDDEFQLNRPLNLKLARI